MNARTSIGVILVIALTLFLSREVQAFSLNDPQGPTFTSDQMAAQLTSGSNLYTAIIAAYNSGTSSYTVPPGDYRFAVSGTSLMFSNLQRSSANPFTINASEATLWFDMNEAEMAGGACIVFSNCSNIVFNGAIIDRGTRGCIEGAITQIDTANNRFEILPSPGIIIPTTFNGNGLIPFKADGRFCAPLYHHDLTYTSITPSANGRYWVTMINSNLMSTISDPNWISTYGDLGTLTVGDGIYCGYTYGFALILDTCDHMMISNVSVYSAKEGIIERYGLGYNTWKDCYFGPRPGTCQWKGADGFMIYDTGHGPTLDNVTLLNTADDMIGMGFHTSTVTAVSGNNVTYKYKLGYPIIVGDGVNFYDGSTGCFLGTASVTAVVSSTVVTLNQAAGGFANATAEWVNHNTANWTIKNCNWHDCYQCIGLGSGPGTVSNCTFTRLGSSVSMSGLAKNITIIGNTFIDVAPMPDGSPIYGYRTPAMPSPSNIVVTSNTFNNSSSWAINLTSFAGLTISNNTFCDPLLYTASYDPGTVGQAIWLNGCSNASITGNSVVAANNDIVDGTLSGTWIADWDASSSTITLDNNITCTPISTNPGLYGIYNPPTVNAGGDGMNYYSNNSVPVGQTFKTGSDANGYTMSGLSVLTGSNASSNPLSRCTYILRIYSISGTTATLLKSGTTSMALTANGDWVKWNINPVLLQPNTTYAYTLSTGGGYINLITTGSNAYAGGEIVKIPAAGGAVTYGNTHKMDAAFEVGLTPQTQPTCTCMATPPNYGPYDIYNPPTTNAGSDGLNYYTNNSTVGQTFTTGSSVNGYAMSSLSVLTGLSASSNPLPLCTYTLRIYSISGSTATLLGSFEKPMALTANGYWVQWNFQPVHLQPNTTYAYTLTTGGCYINLITRGNNAYAGGEIVKIPATGGAVTYGNTRNLDAAFDVGLTPQ